MVLVDSDLSRLPLPDLVLSAVEQLPPPTPQVTVSAPSSPTRDAAFQFPECSGDENGAAPVPSPRPRPRRRRLASEGGGATMKKGPATERICKKCCGHLGQAFNESQWASVGANLRNIADDFHASQTKVSRLSDRLGSTGYYNIKSFVRSNSFIPPFFNLFNLNVNIFSLNLNPDYLITRGSSRWLFRLLTFRLSRLILLPEAVTSSVYDARREREIVYPGAKCTA